jgi:anti-sigma factor RsiW
MMADDVQLLAYVDGLLSPDECAAVEAQLHESAEARHKVQLLRASRVDFAEALAHQKLPPVPESLAAKIDELVRRHQSVPTDVQPTARHADAAPGPARGPRVQLWLAAACVAAAFGCGLLVRLGPLSGADIRDPQGVHASQVANGAHVSPWIAAAVGYQELYTRETVTYMREDVDAASKAVSDIRNDDHLPLRVPDLTSAGLAFKAVQRLRFNNKPLVQIVYLPRSGPPVALCVTKDPRPDEPVETRTVGAMDVAMWRQAELSYALIGKPEGVDLGELGKRIYNLDVAPLFARATAATLALADDARDSVAGTSANGRPTACWLGHCSSPPSPFDPPASPTM